MRKKRFFSTLLPNVVLENENYKKMDVPILSSNTNSIAGGEILQTCSKEQNKELRVYTKRTTQQKYRVSSAPEAQNH